MQANVLTSAGTLQIIASFPPFYLSPSGSYYTKVKNVIYGDCKRM